MQWGSIEEPYWKTPQRNQNNTLIKNPSLQGSAPDQHWNKGDLSWQSRPFERGAKRLLKIAVFSQIWFSLSTPVENSSWPDLTSLSSLAPRDKDVAMTWMHAIGKIILYVMKIKSQGYPWDRYCWKLSSAPHLQRSPHQLQIPIQTVQ